MDSYQRYRLADTLNHLSYPDRLFVLELCILDSRSNIQQVSHQLEIMRGQWAMQLEESQHELQQIKECHIMVMSPRRTSTHRSETTTRDENRWPVVLRSFGIIA
ncbi:uncharacterized protein EAF01_000397 [Botrytis porri]|uniref:uncharacterized protein n=1 Tax=Botrytis porri TaxID=87229 RepID=UPI00190259A3|nr:uncharacterized protein EAF01_000397 [Botrytis porri]KAF7913991.1 hypothetical protein EAF01_000397 [Botrytis porri]